MRISDWSSDVALPIFCRRDRRERHAMKPCCRATEPGETFGRGHLGLLPLRRFASQPVQELRESGAIAEMRLLHSLDLDRILDRLGHPRRVGHVVNLREIGRASCRESVWKYV